MTTYDYSQLLAQLSDLNKTSLCLSEAQKFDVFTKASTLIRESNLPLEQVSILLVAITTLANPTGWYYTSNGISAAIDILDEPYSFVEAA